MIYRLTLVKDLPEADQGFTFFIRGGLASHDGEDWFAWAGREPVYGRMYNLVKEGRAEWVRIEETDLPDNSYELQESFPDHCLLSFKEALDQLGFYYDESYNGINNIRCCDEQVKMLGVTKADCLYCANCGQAVQDAVNFLVWGLSDVAAPHRTYNTEFHYDPYKKYLAGQAKPEYLKK